MPRFSGSSLYATNGHGIVEHDFLTGKESELAAFPTADELWNRLQGAEGISEEIKRAFSRRIFTFPESPLGTTKT